VIGASRDKKRPPCGRPSRSDGDRAGTDRFRAGRPERACLRRPRVYARAYCPENGDALEISETGH